MQEIKDTLKGSWVLGYTQQQGGSVLQAGGRALLIQSKVTKALSTMPGRYGAWTFMAMGISQKMISYVSLRPYAMNEIVRRHLPAGIERPIVVDPAGGYSPEMIWLAESNPNLHAIDMDAPHILEDKRYRLRDFELPKNLEFISADLSKQPLHSALFGRKPHVLIALAAYVDHREFMQLLDYLHTVVADNGIVIAIFPYGPGIDEMRNSRNLFERLAGIPRGVIQSEDELTSMFKQTGYRQIAFYKLSQLATEMEKPTPADIEVIAVIQR